MATSAATLAQLTPDNAELGASPASKRVWGGLPVLWFDKEFGVSSPVPEAHWSAFLPGSATLGYSGTTGIKVVIAWACPTQNVTGSARLAAAFDLKGATDLPLGANQNFPAFGATNEVAGATAVNATTAGGINYTTLSLTIANIKNGQTTSPAIGDWIRVRVRRTVESASDTLSAPIVILGVYLLDY